MSSHPPTRRAVVVGAGPVGCLAAMVLAKRGWHVDLFESRPDIRSLASRTEGQQRSINLAISHRGIAALRAVDPVAAQRILQTAIPMRGRMIHHSKGKLESQLYDKDGQCINSLVRTLFNGALLDETSVAHNIHVFFRQKVESVDFDQKTMSIRDLISNQARTVDFDFCIGADGSYSVIRRQMMRVARMDFHQEYIRDEYIELKMPAGRGTDGEPVFLLDPNHLHIWPRHSFMLIALPNKDKSFTCTLFASSAEFDRLSHPEIVLSWFKYHFPDALLIIGEKALVRDFTRNPRSPLICTKSRPYHYKDRVILLGDAAHSMVPFYGQGLNCGLEDVRILDILLREEGVQSITSSPNFGSSDFIDERLANALCRYSESRHEDLVAISDLAMANYVEMRHAVTTPVYLFKKMLDNLLFSLSSRQQISLNSLGPLLSRIPFAPGEPRGWLPLYTMVTFRPDISYAHARKKAARQSLILAGLGWLGATVVGAVGLWVTRMVLLNSQL